MHLCRTVVVDLPLVIHHGHDCLTASFSRYISRWIVGVEHTLLWRWLSTSLLQRLTFLHRLGSANAIRVSLVELLRRDAHTRSLRHSEVAEQLSIGADLNVLHARLAQLLGNGRLYLLGRLHKRGVCFLPLG